MEKKINYSGADFEIQGEEAIIIDENGNQIDTVCLHSLVKAWLEEQQATPETK